MCKAIYYSKRLRRNVKKQFSSVAKYEKARKALWRKRKIRLKRVKSFPRVIRRWY